MIRIGVISDTHGLLRPEAAAKLANVEHIIHAGDIGSPGVIAGLRKIAPVVAIRGNNDKGEWAADIPKDAVVRLGGRLVYVLHNVNELDLDPAAAGFDVVVSGHSHNPSADIKDSVLFLNPGSAGPRRFKLPIALAVLELTDDGIRPRIYEIAK
jgi:hypothetical protein